MQEDHINSDTSEQQNLTEKYNLKPNNGTPSAEWSVKLKSSALNSKQPVHQPDNGAL